MEPLHSDERWNTQAPDAKTPKKYDRIENGGVAELAEGGGLEK